MALAARGRPAFRSACRGWAVRASGLCDGAAPMPSAQALHEAGGELPSAQATRAQALHGAGGELPSAQATGELPSAPALHEARRELGLLVQWAERLWRDGAGAGLRSLREGDMLRHEFAFAAAAGRRAAGGGVGDGEVAAEMVALIGSFGRLDAEGSGGGRGHALGSVGRRRPTAAALAAARAVRALLPLAAAVDMPPSRRVAVLEAAAAELPQGPAPPWARQSIARAAESAAELGAADVAALLWAAARLGIRDRASLAQLSRRLCGVGAPAPELGRGLWALAALGLRREAAPLLDEAAATVPAAVAAGAIRPRCATDIAWAVFRLRAGGGEAQPLVEALMEWLDSSADAGDPEEPGAWRDEMDSVVAASLRALGAPVRRVPPGASALLRDEPHRFLFPLWGQSSIDEFRPARERELVKGTEFAFYADEPPAARVAGTIRRVDRAEIARRAKEAKSRRAWREAAGLRARRPDVWEREHADQRTNERAAAGSLRHRTVLHALLELASALSRNGSRPPPPLLEAAQAWAEADAKWAPAPCHTLPPGPSHPRRFTQTAGTGCAAGDASAARRGAGCLAGRREGSGSGDLSRCAGGGGLLRRRRGGPRQGRVPRVGPRV